MLPWNSFGTLWFSQHLGRQLVTVTWGGPWLWLPGKYRNGITDWNMQCPCCIASAMKCDSLHVPFQRQDGSISPNHPKVHFCKFLFIYLFIFWEIPAGIYIQHSCLVTYCMLAFLRYHSWTMLYDMLIFVLSLHP